MKFYIDRKQMKVLKRRAKSVALRVINTFRYRSPGPIGISNIADLAQGDAVKILWEGEAPPTQHFHYCQPPNFLNLSNLTFTKPFAVALRGGRIYGERGYVITNDGYILTDVNPEMSQNRDQHSLMKRGPMPIPETIDGTVALLNSAGYNNYFHYLFDTLGRLQYLDQVSIDIDYYYTPYNTRFQKELLKLFEIPESKIIRAEKNRHIVANRLLITSVPGDTISTDKRYKPYKDLGTYQYISQKILSKLPQPNLTESSTLMYIQRRGSRAIENERHLFEGLDRIGNWKIVRLEEHSVSEQARLFHNAKLIVALHGAGLANLIYCRPQTAVVEITNPAYPSPLYYQMANLLQLKYYPIIGNAKEGIVSAKNDIRSNVRIDIALTLKTIHQVLNTNLSVEPSTSNMVSDE